MRSFKFDLNELVCIASSLERGSVIGRAQYTLSESTYLIRYVTAEGRATEAWWSESALSTDF